MSERKVLNKYFPPDFDPSKVPRGSAPPDKQQKVRLMAPFSMRCLACRDYIYKGKKFNARKETVEGERYLSIRVFRFYIRCPKCAAEITFKTDPANSDYRCEHGAVRVFDPYAEKDQDGGDGPGRIKSYAEREAAEAEAEGAAPNPMAALESRTDESKREMDILDALDEIRTRNARLERVAPDGALQKLARGGDDDSAVGELDAQDEALVRALFHDGVEGAAVRRVQEDADAIDPVEYARGRLGLDEGSNGASSASEGMASKKRASSAADIGVRRKKAAAVAAAVAVAAKKSVLGALQGYSSESDSD